MDASDPSFGLLSSRLLPGKKVTEEKQPECSITLKRAIINALIDGAAFIRPIPVFISGIMTFWIPPSRGSGF